MRREEHRPGRSLTVGFILVATGVVLAGTIQPVLSAQPAPAPKGDDHDADRAAILAVMKSLRQAFEKADAKAIAATWTSEGEYTAADGTTLHGREALEKAYGEFFKKNPKVTLDYESESLRFVSRETAVGEGYATLHRVPSEPPTVSRVSTLFAREDGQWRIALLREWPDEETSLRELSWLIGSWSSKEGDRPVQTTYEWEGEKAFIRARFSVELPEKPRSGIQMIGKDPSSGELRSWTFESTGGFGEGSWSRDGNQWLVDATVVLPDGGRLTATNILTKIDNDTFTWQSIKRKFDDADLPDAPPVKVTRIKSAK